MADYCNITTDLTRVFPQINDYHGRERLVGWTIASGQTNTYYVPFQGYIDNVFENGIALTSRSSIADTESNAGSYYSDTTNNVLYVHTSGSDAPTGYELEAGEDWVTLKTWARDKAQQQVDADLNSRYSTPLLPRIDKDHDIADFEFPIVEATAVFTCYLLVRRVTRGADHAQMLLKMYSNPNPDIGEQKGIIDKLKDGDTLLQDQISPREAGKFNVRAGGSNSTELLKIIGTYTGTQAQRWKLVIDTAGAPGTATYKLSYDNGTNYDYTLEETTNEDNLYVNLNYGLWGYFPASSYSLNDTWTIDVYPQDASLINGAKVGTVILER